MNPLQSLVARLTGNEPVNNERLPGESFEAYRARRKRVNAATKAYLHGRYFHVSAECVGKDAKGRWLFRPVTYNVGRNKAKRERKAGG